MFCKNCGKQVPNDSTYCPYCGSTLKAWEKPIPESQKVPVNQVYSPAVQQPTIMKPVKSRGQILSEKLDQLGPEKTKKLLRFSQFFQASSIIFLISVLIFFGSSPILSISEKRTPFLITWQIILMVWCIGLIGISSSNVIVAAIRKKEFQLRIKSLIIVKVICILLNAGLLTMLIIRTASSVKLTESEMLIPTMILSGLNFVTSGLNGGVTSQYVVLTPKRIAEANNWKNSQKTVSK